LLQEPEHAHGEVLELRVAASLPVEDQGAVQKVVREVQCLSDGDASLSHKARWGDFTEHVTDQDRAVETLGDFRVPAAECNAQFLFCGIRRRCRMGSGSWCRFEKLVGSSHLPLAIRLQQKPPALGRLSLTC
jgi:hypothetical protein